MGGMDTAGFVFAHQETRRAVARPWRRIDHVVRAEHDVVGREATPRRGYASDLRIEAIEACAVCDVHRHVLKEHDVEGLRPKRQVQRVADLERNAVGETRTIREVGGGFHEASAQIDARDATSERGRNVSRRTADAAARSARCS